jgi:polyhydroxybutyrate depolymerase
MVSTADGGPGTKKILAFAMAAALIALLAPGRPALEATASSTSGAPARGTKGCGVTSPVTPGASRMFVLRVGGLDRRYLVHLPPDYDTRRPVSLVLDFHGLGGDSASEEIYTGLSDHADRHGYVVVYPESTGFLDEDGRMYTTWNDRAGNASPGPEGPICTEAASLYPHPPECGAPTPCNWNSCHDDVAFVRQLLDHFEATFCIDRDRVYATGMSNGGMFVHRLGCEIPERFAAIAPVSGTLARGFNCAPPRSAPLAMMNISGSLDHYVSERGDVSSDGYCYESAEDVLGKWAGPESQGCDAESTPYPTSLDGTLDLACTQRAHCATGAELVNCTWKGRHDWPRAGTRPFANELIWEFFSKHSRAAHRSAPVATGH